MHTLDVVNGLILAFNFLAALFSLVRVLQNERYYRWSKKVHKQGKKK